MLFYKTIAEKVAARTQETGPKYAAFGTRLSATFIDLLISVVVLLPVFWGLSYIIHQGISYTSEGRELLGQLIKIGLDKEAGQYANKTQAMSTAVYDFLVQHPGVVTAIIIDYITQLVILTVVIFVFWKYRAATPGKMIVGIEIVDATTLKEPSSRQYVVRLLGYIISTLPCGLGFLWIAFNKKHRGWHDYMAKTVVIAK